MHRWGTAIAAITLVIVVAAFGTTALAQEGPTATPVPEETTPVPETEEPEGPTAAEQTRIAALKKKINSQRRATWQWQKKGFVRRSRTDYAERRTSDISRLENLLERWQTKRSHAKRYVLSWKYAKRPLSPAKAKIVGQRMASKFYGWSGVQWRCLKRLWGPYESSWRWWADNPTSSAYGIPQALPGSKMGKGWRRIVFVQIRWGLKYIKTRPGYGSPCNALAFRLANGWY